MFKNKKGLLLRDLLTISLLSILILTLGLGIFTEMNTFYGKENIDVDVYINHSFVTYINDTLPNIETELQDPHWYDIMFTIFKGIPLIIGSVFHSFGYISFIISTIFIKMGIAPFYANTILTLIYLMIFGGVIWMIIAFVHRNK